MINDFPGIIGVQLVLDSVEAFQAIGSIEELADISADIVLKAEFTSRVLIKERTKIDDHIVQNHQFLPFLHPLLKLFQTNNSLLTVAEWQLSFQILLIPSLNCCKSQSGSYEMIKLPWNITRMLWRLPIIV